MDKLIIEAVVHPTEDEEKVSEAIRNMFGDIRLRKVQLNSECLLRFEQEDLKALTALKRELEREHIRDAARALLLRNIEANHLAFGLNKQAAYAGHISFYSPGESALGPINIRIRTDDPKKAVEWLTAKADPAQRRHVSGRTR